VAEEAAVAAVDVEEAEAAAGDRVTYEVHAVHEPLARIVKRDATLDGAVPLRVAQACVPLLEGNALGKSVSFGKRLVWRSRLGRKGFAATDDFAAVDRAHRAAVAMLVAEGLIERKGEWHRRLEKSWWWIERGIVRVWTGLVVTARDGTWIRVCGPGNRGAIGARVRPSYVGGAESVPLVIDFDVLDDDTRLEGHVATLVPIVPSVSARIEGADGAEDLLAAHAEFYDAKYFATKKGETTKKYRRTITKHDEPPAKAPAVLRVAHLAGPKPEIVTIDEVLGASSTAPVRARRGERFDVVRFANAVPFAAHYDGNTLDVVPDKEALARGARAVEAAVGDALGKGARLYLTKYFTPHPHGEPHFFVKPWAFTETPRGWSSVLDGIRGEGYDVMRGVVWTDRFHATPAVFDVVPMRLVRVAEGAPLLEVFAIPRNMRNMEDD
jgi:hypothetical protein